MQSSQVLTVLGHECWWTRRKATEIRRDASGLGAMGIPLAAIRAAAASHGMTFDAVDSSEDDDTMIVTIGPIAGTVHDGCMLSVENSGEAAVDLVIAAALEVHSTYLGSRPVGQAAGYLRTILIPGNVVRIVTQGRRMHIGAHRADSSWLSRLFAATRRFEG